MLGFFTIFAFVIAWTDGGWWWVIAIFLALVWIGKKGQEIENSSPEEPKAETTMPKADSQTGGEEIVPTSTGLGEVDEWVWELTEICLRYEVRDFYVAGHIPNEKLEKAVRSYPLRHAPESIVVALIDTTLNGSAERGMLICDQGLSWRNLTPPAASLSWSEFRQQALSVKGSDLHIGRYNVFKTAGSYFSANAARLLLTDIGELLKRREGSQAIATSEGSVSGPKDEGIRREPARSSGIAVVDINQAPYDELISLPGIGAAEAVIIMERRGSQSFPDFESLSDFLGLKPHTANQLQTRVMFSTPSRMPEKLSPPNPQTSPDAPAFPNKAGHRVID